MRFLFSLILFVLFSNVLFSQTFEELSIKENFDRNNSLLLYNNTGSINYDPCNCSTQDIPGIFGDGMSYVLEGYITMYKTTGDEAYLYKFILQSVCMIQKRNSNYRWSVNSNYQDGNILAAFARFVFFIKNESGFSTILFDKELINLDTLKDDYSGPTFSTYGNFANWLQDRCGETIWWYISNGYWDDYKGFKRSSEVDAAASQINWQVGFGRALLFIGLSSNNQNLISKSAIIASLYKSQISITDYCTLNTYNEPLLKIDESTNSYKWYHAGWRIQRRQCFPLENVADYDNYLEYKEDISHGATVTFLPFDYIRFQTNSLFNTNDMVHFRNMFSKNIYNQNTGNFSNAVDGTDGPVFSSNTLAPLCYMPYEIYDGANSQATTPNVYDIIMNFYINQVANNTNLPSGYFGMHNKGHAEIVQAQWKYECPDLTIYNRRIVYNQNFFAKGNLTVAPYNSSNYSSYAEPIISTPTFTIDENIIVNMSSGSSIKLQNGFQAKSGCIFRASINPLLCDANNTKSIQNNQNSTHSILDDHTIIDTTTNPNTINLQNNALNVFPSPFSESITAQVTLKKQSKISLTIFDVFGRKTIEKIQNLEYEGGVYDISVSTNFLIPGIYYCVLNIDNQEIITKTIVKK